MPLETPKLQGRIGIEIRCWSNPPDLGVRNAELGAEVAPIGEESEVKEPMVGNQQVWMRDRRDDNVG